MFYRKERFCAYCSPCAGTDSDNRKQSQIDGSVKVECTESLKVNSLKEGGSYHQTPSGRSIFIHQTKHAPKVVFWEPTYRKPEGKAYRGKNTETLNWLVSPDYGGSLYASCVGQVFNGMAIIWLQTSNRWCMQEEEMIFKTGTINVTPKKLISSEGYATAKRGLRILRASYGDFHHKKVPVTEHSAILQDKSNYEVIKSARVTEREIYDMAQTIFG